MSFWGAFSDEMRKVAGPTKVRNKNLKRLWEKSQTNEGRHFDAVNKSTQGLLRSRLKAKGSTVTNRIMEVLRKNKMTAALGGGALAGGLGGYLLGRRKAKKEGSVNEPARTA